MFAVVTSGYRHVQVFIYKCLSTSIYLQVLTSVYLQELSSTYVAFGWLHVVKGPYIQLQVPESSYWCLQVYWGLQFLTCLQVLNGVTVTGFCRNLQAIRSTFGVFTGGRSLV